MYEEHTLTVDEWMAILRKIDELEAKGVPEGYLQDAAQNYVSVNEAGEIDGEMIIQGLELEAEKFFDLT